jgi:hypothetical protein
MSRPDRPIRAYVICYGLWLLTVALGLLDFAAARIWLQEGYVLLGLNPWGFAAARNFGLILFALLWLGGILYAEDHYRKGVVKRQLWRCVSCCTVASRARTMAGITFEGR